MKTLALTVLLAVLGSAVRADKEAPPFSFTEKTADGKYIFVMLAPEERLGSWNDETCARIQRIRETYKVSGLYRADNPHEPLWTVDWYAFDVVPISDGHHLIRWGGWAWSRAPEWPAVGFYADGKLLRDYNVSDLVSWPSLMPHSVSHFTWRKSSVIDEENLQLTLTTYHLERYTFDLTTGEIVGSFRPPRWILGFILLVIAFFVYRFIRRRRKTRAQAS